MQDPPLFTRKDFVERLCQCANRQDRPVLFLLGSAVTAPNAPGERGVPNVSGTIELIQRALGDDVTRGDLARELEGAENSAYQRAFSFLIGRRGQDVANEVVRRAVCHARDDSRWPGGVPRTEPERADASLCKILESDNEGWELPRAVDELGRLVVTYPDVFGRCVLTTNFDPLIEISIARHGGQHYRTVLHQDGNLGQTVGPGCHVVHLHGYWYGFDTLHTSAQLNQERPQLRKALRRLVEASTLVVLGYGGWDDVLTKTLAELLGDSESTPELLWAFHGDDDELVRRNNDRLLRLLAPGIGRGRVALYKGIDAYEVLSATTERLASHYAAPRVVTRVSEAETPGLSSQGRHVRIEISVPLPTELSAEPDSPPRSDAWVGRTRELSILQNSDNKVVFITGIGGQGKSLLAAEFMRYTVASSQGSSWWDWRDCREESDRLTTQLLRIIERLSDGALSASRIDTHDIRAVVAVFFQTLGPKKALFVFDNVDQYIDLETFAPVKGLEVLLSAANTRLHNARFIFTCRPEVRLGDDRALIIPLDGLTLEETHSLLVKRGIPAAELALDADLHRITNGHPLWTNLVAMQSLRNQKGLSGTLENIRRGGAGLPETTRSIWKTLDEPQRKVLCTMAELDRPEPESQLLAFLPGQNANRVGRALRTLKSLYLVETKYPRQGEARLDLHPIIRQFVRTEFPKKEREKFVGSILSFLDRMIGRFKGLLTSTPAYEVLEHWTRKADFQITFGRLEAATATIDEIREPLVARGYAEELVRICTRLFDAVDWSEACSSYKGYDSVFGQAVTLVVQYGNDTLAKTWLETYRNAIPGKSAQYIHFCDLACYTDWFAGRFDAAISWGEEGERLKKGSAVDTAFSCAHNLALARRDAGRIDEALSDFLGTEKLENVLATAEPVFERGAHFYGNIGRCLHLKGDLVSALHCLRKSAQLLAGAQDHADLNRGYARLWIGQILCAQGKLADAAMCFRAAECAWEDSAPPRAALARAELEKLAIDNEDSRKYLSLSAQHVDAEYSTWLSRDST